MNVLNFPIYLNEFRGTKGLVDHYQEVFSSQTHFVTSISLDDDPVLA